MENNSTKPKASERSPHADFIDHMQRVYPGVQIFFAMSRHEESGVTSVAIFDLERNADEPLYLMSIHPRDLLLAGSFGSFAAPAMSWQENLRALETGELPAGYVTAEY